LIRVINKGSSRWLKEEKKLKKEKRKLRKEEEEEDKKFSLNTPLTNLIL
tara:strand:+ start:679 stop:825 length:147 start_codon:yes stop_codon:yes gene_type:complete